MKYQNSIDPRGVIKEIRKDEVSVEDWQKAFNGLKIDDEYLNKRATHWQKYLGGEMPKWYSDDITAIRKAPQSEEKSTIKALEIDALLEIMDDGEDKVEQARRQVEAIKPFCALSCFEQIELQEQNANLLQQIKELTAALSKAQEQIQGLDDTLECALCLINYYQKQKIK